MTSPSYRCRTGCCSNELATFLDNLYDYPSLLGRLLRYAWNLSQKLFESLAIVPRTITCLGNKLNKNTHNSYGCFYFCYPTGIRTPIDCTKNSSPTIRRSGKDRFDTLPENLMGGRLSYWSKWGNVSECTHLQFPNAAPARNLLISFH